MAAGNIVLGADRGTGDFAGRAWSGDDSYIEVLAMVSGDMVGIKHYTCCCNNKLFSGHVLQRCICELLPGTSETMKCGILP